MRTYPFKYASANSRINIGFKFKNRIQFIQQSVLQSDVISSMIFKEINNLKRMIVKVTKRELIFS